MMLHRTITPLALALVALTSPLVVAQDCALEQTNVATCIATNVLSCATCGTALGEWPSFFGECDDINDICALANCCAPCASPATDYAECVLQDGCDKTCDNVAPSPVAPNPLFPSFFEPTIGEDDDISPECADEFQTYFTCIASNAFACAASCNDEGGNDDGGNFECADIAAICDTLTCCPNCIQASKSFIACEANIRGCSENCNDVQPVAPSPVAPFSIFPVAAPSPVAPTAPVVPGPCDELVEAHANCFVANFACQFSFQCNNLPPLEVAPEFCSDAGRELFCAMFTCCDECEATGKAVASCTFESAGCEETICGDFAPIAPSPVAPFQVFPPSPTAPFAPASPAFALVGCDTELEMITACADNNGCDDTCGDLDFPSSCDAFPDVCGLVTVCCPICVPETIALFNCAARGQLGCSADCDGPIAPAAPPIIPDITAAPVDAPVVVAPTTGAPVTVAPITVAPVTTAPMAPATDAPVTVSPITKAPITNVPATSAPVTMEPATMLPVTPTTPSPIMTTSVPVTPSPVTPAPTSSASRSMGVAAIMGVIIAVLCI